VLGYRGEDWIVLGLFLGVDAVTREVEEYLVLERSRNGSREAQDGGF